GGGEGGAGGSRAPGGGAGWFPPRPSARFDEVELRQAATPFDGDPGGLEHAFELLARGRRSLPAGTFVFVCSDFLSPPSPEAWLGPLGLRRGVGPGVVQGPVCGRGFPPVG